MGCFRTRVAGILLIALLCAASAGMLVSRDSGSAAVPACHAHHSSQTQHPAHPADHFCCMVGHNRSLPNSPVAIPVVAVIAILPVADLLAETSFTTPDSNLPSLSASPPLLSSLRI